MRLTRDRLFSGVVVLTLAAGSIWWGQLAYHNRVEHFRSQRVDATVPELIVARNLAGEAVGFRPANLERPTLLFVLSVDCVYCQETTPVWSELARSAGVEVVALSTSAPDETAAYLEEHHLEARLLMIDEAELAALGLRGVPATLALSSGDTTLRSWIGVLGPEDRDAITDWATVAR